MGFHLFDLIPILLIALAIFGPKAMQSMARDAGKGVREANKLKEKVMAELPMEEISEVTSHIPRVPTSPYQVVQMLMAPEKKEPTVKEEMQGNLTSTKSTTPPTPDTAPGERREA